MDCRELSCKEMPSPATPEILSKAEAKHSEAGIALHLSLS